MKAWPEIRLRWAISCFVLSSDPEERSTQPHETARTTVIPFRVI
jgi:hypothetical protein